MSRQAHCSDPDEATVLQPATSEAKQASRARTRTRRAYPLGKRIIFASGADFAQALSEFDWDWQDAADPTRRAAGERQFGALVAASRTSPTHRRIWEMFLRNIDRDRTFAAAAQPPRSA